MLTVTGLLLVEQPPQETKTPKGSYFNFRGKGKHPREDKYTYYNVSIFVREKFLDDARRCLVEGAMVQIRMAELDGRKIPPKDTVFNDVKTSYDNIETLTLYPGKTRKT